MTKTQQIQTLEAIRYVVEQAPRDAFGVFYSPQDAMQNIAHLLGMYGPDALPIETQKIVEEALKLFGPGARASYAKDYALRCQSKYGSRICRKCWDVDITDHHQCAPPIEACPTE